MPKKNKMDDLRDHLFETLEMLKDPDCDLDIQKAKTIAEIGRVLVDSARVEVEFMKESGCIGSGFINDGSTPEPKQIGVYTNGRGTGVSALR